jgi:ketosteroid isomerase-like protein
MSMQKAIYATAQDAEAAFYETIERGDLEALMSLWAEDEEIVCILPGGPRLAGYASIREAWQHLFNASARLSIRAVHQSHLRSPFVAVHSLLEYVSVQGDESLRAPLVATNIYLRGPLGWRMVLHHSSPAPPEVPLDMPKILH